MLRKIITVITCVGFAFLVWLLVLMFLEDTGRSPREQRVRAFKSGEQSAAERWQDLETISQETRNH